MTTMGKGTESGRERERIMKCLGQGEREGDCDLLASVIRKMSLDQRERKKNVSKLITPGPRETNQIALQLAI